MCGAELKPLPEGVQCVARLLQGKGNPHGVFKLQPDDLQQLTGAPMVDVAEQGAP